MWQGRKFPRPNTARGTCRTCVVAEQNGSQAHDVFCKCSLPEFRRIPRRHYVHCGGLTQWCSSEKESTSNAGDAGDAGSIPGSGRGKERNASHSNYSCLEKSHGQRSLAATVHGVRKESETTEHNTQHISLTSAWTSALCSESAESQPADRQRTSYGQLLEAMTQSLLSV